MQKFQTRTMQSDFKLRRDGEDNHPVIEGYFSVFNTNYDMGMGMSESIAPGAFDDALTDDIRALIDHETRLVLGRNTVGTLRLTTDSRGLWGEIDINPNDTDAMNLVARVERGDVSQCSFGFDILDEETEFRDDGSIHWTIKAVKLYEVSVCTFPAYKDTAVSCRSQQKEEILKRKNDAWREAMLKKLNGGVKNA